MPSPAQRRKDDLDPLLIAGVVGMIVIGVLAVADIAVNGQLNPAILGLLVSMLGPIIPALIVSQRRNDDDD